ncbi:hypothetical protein [Mycetocola saprophilus]|uniref:hypothetical protein n=1 Tax=Mycetocola saprophilus TaxID=76636 RepID=UPI0004C12C22|nr:hypothetical protein [Mycetocola saprophilus]
MFQTSRRRPPTLVTLGALALTLVGCSIEDDSLRFPSKDASEETREIDYTDPDREKVTLDDGMPPLNADLTLEEVDTSQLMVADFSSAARVNEFGAQLATALERLDNVAFNPAATAETRDAARDEFLRDMTQGFEFSEPGRHGLNSGAVEALRFGTDPVPDGKSTVTASRVRFAGGGLTQREDGATRADYEILFARDLTGSPVRERWDEYVPYTVIFQENTGVVIGFGTER